MAAHSRALGGESYIDNPAARAVSGKPDNGAALPLAQLARGARYVGPLSRRTDDDGPALRRGGVSCLRAWQHYYHRPGLVVGQRVGVGQIIGR